MKKAKRGRPALPSDKRREVFALRLSRREREVIEQAARGAREKVSDWVRLVLLSAAEKAGEAHTLRV